MKMRKVRKEDLKSNKNKEHDVEKDEKRKTKKRKVYVDKEDEIIVVGS